MRISFNWLKDYCKLDVTPKKLATDLSMFGFNVESIGQIDGDWVLDLEISPNRGDCLSILGMAREIAALYKLKFNPSLGGQGSKLEIKSEELDKEIKITIANPQICQRYSARIIDNIKIGPSPLYIQKRLKAYGFRPINNIVDITNYVMIAAGQPLHAFDYGKIKDGVMNIRLSQEGEKITTLDGKEHNLPEKAIIIEDKKEIYDLAGIMGGAVSEIDQNTRTIILQGAIFDPVLIRRASKKLNLITDASYRYERGVDIEATCGGVDLAASLIKESATTAKIGQLIDIRNSEFQSPKIKFQKEEINKLLGVKMNSAAIIGSLERLYFKVEKDAVIIPSFRSYDVKIWQDLAEEIARIYGYDKILPELPKQVERSHENQDWQKRESLKNILENCGFIETRTFTFLDKKQLELLGYVPSDCAEVANPITPETQYLRPSLLFSLLTDVAKNPWSPEIAIFEIDKVYRKNQESWQVGLAIVGRMENIIQSLPAKIKAGLNVKLLDQRILDYYKIRRQAYVAIADVKEIDISLQAIVPAPIVKKYREISKFPPTVRDLAFVVAKEVVAKDIEDVILKTSDNIFFVEVFDEFVLKKFGNHKKNLAFHIWFEDLRGPVEVETADKIIQEIIKTIENKFDAELRS